jgi:hypothetical protein
MSLVFLISLTIVLICAYICKHSPDEIAELAASILLLSLIGSLVLAPWLLQFLLLILVVVSNKRQLLPSERRTEPQAETKIQLMYRSVKYEPTSSSVEGINSEFTGTYWGQAWRVRT